MTAPGQPQHQRTLTPTGLGVNPAAQTEDDLLEDAERSAAVREPEAAQQAVDQMYVWSPGGIEKAEREAARETEHQAAARRQSAAWQRAVDRQERNLLLQEQGLPSEAPGWDSQIQVVNKFQGRQFRQEIVGEADRRIGQRRAAERAERELFQVEDQRAAELREDERAAAREVQLAEQRGLWQKKMVRAGCVVATLTTLAVIVTVVVMETGSGPPNRGNEVNSGGRRLGGDASDGLRGARPSYFSWSGFLGGAHDYESKVNEQQARVEAIIQADQQVAEAVATQADHVKQARRDLEIVLAALIGGIGVAMALTALWQAACDVLIKQTYEMVLIGFGAVLALAVIAEVIAVLVNLDDAGTHTQRSLAPAIETYQWVVDDVLAKLPSGAGATRWAPTALRSGAASSSELVSGPSAPLLYASSVADVGNSTGGGQVQRGAVVALLDNLLGNNLLQPQTPGASESEPPTLGQLAGLCQQATVPSGSGSPLSNSTNRSAAQVQWLAVITPPTALAAIQANPMPTKDFRTSASWPEATPGRCLTRDAALRRFQAAGVRSIRSF
ncbi:MAG: hypothetical protein K2Q25_13475 [Mycobacteriaceae bacterium]|nr:hypothetical protein [Mycobacteriaceae bacterium]